jgi:hypothetical protein
MQGFIVTKMQIAYRGEIEQNRKGPLDNGPVLEYK